VRPSGTRSVAVVVVFLLIGCGGGGSGGNSGTVTPPSGNGPTSGEYLFQGNSGSSLNVSLINSTTGALSSPTLATNTPADDSSNYPGVVVIPSDKFLYALYTSFTVIQGFQLVGPGLQLNVLPAAPFFPSASGPFNSLTIHPSGGFLYVIESPATIEEFSIEATTGNLTHASAVTETADFRVGVIDSAGKFFFATDLTGGRIFAYQINQTSGALSAVAGSPFIVPANGQPILDVIDRTGKFLYAPLFAGGVAAFLVDSSTGGLTNVPGSPFATSNLPSFIVIAPSGKFLYVTNFRDGSIDGFGMDTNTGALSHVTGSPFSTAPSPSNIVVDPTGKFLYVSTYPNSSIYGFSVDSTTGGLSAITGSPFSSLPNPTNLMILKVP
jgi:6-phosphogluconolactonase